MIRLRRLLPLVVAALGGACAHPPPPLHAAKLEVERPNPETLRPFIRATVAGQPVKLLVDTGAFHSLLPARFARAQKLPQRSGAAAEIMIDANGNRATMALLPDVPVQFDGEASGGTLDFFMNPSERHAAFVLAPQELLRPGWALVIDLEHELLSYEAEEGALKRLGLEGKGPLREVEFSRCLREGFFERNHRIVDVTINGVPTRLMIDTGAELTTLSRNNAALPSLASARGDVGSTLGLTSEGRGLLVGGITIEFSGTSFVLPVAVSPASSLCGQGVLGTNLLRHCTLVWGYGALWATCRAPAGRE